MGGEAVASEGVCCGCRMRAGCGWVGLGRCAGEGKEEGASSCFLKFHMSSRLPLLFKSRIFQTSSYPTKKCLLVAKKIEKNIYIHSFCIFMYFDSRREG